METRKIREGRRRAGGVLRRARARALGAPPLVALTGALTASASQSWWHEAPLRVEVHDHAFRRASANAIGCEVRIRLYFDAPAEKYAEPVAERNHYRFLAELKLSGGHRFVSPVFGNTQPGARVMSFSHDSQFDGCWAERPRKLRKVDVHACRGVGCVPHGFD